MLREILPYLGYDLNQIPENAELFFVLNNAPKSWMAFVFFAFLITLLFVAYKLNRKEHDVCPVSIKKLLGALRVTILIFISLIFLDPALVISIKKLIDPQILILVDNSTSMNIQDNYMSQASQNLVKPYLDKSNNAKRLNLLGLALNQYSIDESLKAKGTVRLYSFEKSISDEYTNQKLTKVIDQLKGDHPYTDITGSVKNVVHLHNGKKIAGIILITDGRSNTGTPLSELTQYMMNQKIPVFSIGVGNSEKAKNIKISDLWLPDRVFKDDPFLIQAKISGSQIKGEKVELQLIEIPLNKQGEPLADNFKIIEQKPVVFSENEQEQTINFEYKSDKEGGFIYKIKVVPLEFESITIDNEKEAQTEILSKSARILLVAGTSTWDYRILKTLLTRDKTINVSCWLQSMDIDMVQDGDTAITKLPDSESDLFVYDVVILLDPNPIEFDEKWIDLLQKFIEEKKGGLMYIAGPNFTSQTFSLLSTQKLKDLLPVQFSDLQREHKDFMNVTYEIQWPFHLTLDGQSHNIGKLNNDNNINKEIWKSLQGVYWSYPVVEAKAGAKVLLEHTDPKLILKEKNRPLLVTGIFGSGRTIYMGFNNIWRWRKNSEKYFDKFWIQNIRYLIEGKLDKDFGKSNLFTNKDKVVIGENINISAKIYDELGQPFEAEKLKGKVFKGTNLIAEFILHPEINRKGFYGGDLKAEIPGSLNLTLEIPELTSLNLEKMIKIEQPIIEFEDAEMNYLGLRELSEKTKGKFYHISEFGQLSEDFPNVNEKLVINLPPDSLWDSGRFFVLIILLLSIEWTIRKKYKLL